ncbi:MAG: hypothetical protein IT282_16310 [Bacteroidetes bacterium]|nr:hypothetical protein [Bacteroidota bacterium]
MDWQQIVTWSIIACTAALMLGSRLRRWRKGSARRCTSGCQCPGLDIPIRKPYLDAPSTRLEKRS